MSNNTHTQKQKPPNSIRFNEEKLAFIMKKEGLKSPQKVVNFLLDQYWWKHHFEAEAAPTYPTAPVKQPIDRAAGIRALKNKK